MILKCIGLLMVNIVYVTDIVPAKSSFKLKSGKRITVEIVGKDVNSLNYVHYSSTYCHKGKCKPYRATEMLRCTEISDKDYKKLKDENVVFNIKDDSGSII